MLLKCSEVFCSGMSHVDPSSRRSYVLADIFRAFEGCVWLHLEPLKKPFLPSVKPACVYKVVSGLWSEDEDESCRACRIAEACSKLFQVSNSERVQYVSMFQVACIFKAASMFQVGNVLEIGKHLQAASTFKVVEAVHSVARCRRLGCRGPLTMSSKNSSGPHWNWNSNPWECFTTMDSR